MRINKIINRTYAEGPGCRFCIWVQGCNHRCNGCFATELWDYTLGIDISVDEIINQILDVKDDIEGITFLGGEPIDKAKDLSIIAKKVKELNKNVITFTGYTYSDLIDKNNSDINELLKYTDVLIDGEFIEELLDYSRPLVGSSNQNFVFLTDDIKEEDLMNYKNRIEIRTNSNGIITFNGMGNIKKLKELMSKIK